MSLVVIKQKLLKILAENTKNRYPQVVSSEELASRLGMNEQKTRQIVRSMQGLGVIESDLEGQYALITLKGLSWVKNMVAH